MDVGHSTRALGFIVNRVVTCWTSAPRLAP